MAAANRGPILRGGAFRLAEAGTVTASGTNTDTYLPTAGFWMDLDGYAGVEIVTVRTADSGTCTMDVFVEQYNPVTQLYTAVQDAAGNDVSGVQYADGATGEQRIRIHPSPIAVDADGVLIVNTVDKWFQQSAPRYCRIRVRSGGTTVTNTFSMLAIPLR
jgi:hypothetical protein